MILVTRNFDTLRNIIYIYAYIYITKQSSYICLFVKQLRARIPAAYPVYKQTSVYIYRERDRRAVKQTNKQTEATTQASAKSPLHAESPLSRKIP